MTVRIGNRNEPCCKLKIEGYKVIISGMLSGILGYVEILGFGWLLVYWGLEVEPGLAVIYWRIYWDAATQLWTQAGLVMTTLGVLSFTMPPYGITIYHQNLLKQSINPSQKENSYNSPHIWCANINSFGKMINSANMAIKLALVWQF